MKRLKRKNFLEKLPENSVLVSRPSRYGNPYRIPKYFLEESIDLYEFWLTNKLLDNPKFLDPLIGKNLVCYCDLDQLCHADILIKYCKKIKKGKSEWAN